MSDDDKETEADKSKWAQLSAELFSRPNFNEFKGYPDRYRVHWQLARKLFGLPFQDVHFLLVNSVEEAYEPIVHVLARHKMRASWHESGLSPLVRIALSDGQPDLFKATCVVATQSRAENIVAWLSHYLVTKSARYRVINDIVALDSLEGDASIEDAMVIVVDEVLVQQPALILQLCSRYQLKWIVVHLSPSMSFDVTWNNCLSSALNLILIFELPSTLKTGGESPSAVLIANPTLINQLQAHSYVVWYNMDFLHMHMLLFKLKSLTTDLVKDDSHPRCVFAAEAERVVRGKIRMDFNETRTQPSAAVFDKVGAQVVGTDYLAAFHDAAYALSIEYKVPCESILLSSGANHALKRAIVGVTAPGQPIVLPDITYIAHVKAAIAAEAEIIYVPTTQELPNDPLSLTWDIEGMIAAVRRYQPRLLCISNPSNPLGEVLDATSFDNLIQELRCCSKNTILLVDACFHHFGTATGFKMPQYSEYIESCRILVVGSLSKEDGYAGARAGFLFGSKYEVEIVRSTFPQEHPTSLLGVLTMRTARDPSMVPLRMHTINSLVHECLRIQEGIKNLEEQHKIGMNVRICAASFVLLYIPAIPEDLIVIWFQKHANIDLAYVKRFDYSVADSFNNPSFHVSGESVQHLLRISPGTPCENSIFLEQLSVFLAEYQSRKM